MSQKGFHYRLPIKHQEMKKEMKKLKNKNTKLKIRLKGLTVS